ncbi:MAG: hypothetical protein BJ554DRAFT_241 [Olpidium bornovanus]|uniref:Uncharacterized protein n=1 Tax=Olpidium bornovanus TaxID=278681 RepID=A0A8H8A1Q3_9FUNG|nr:MAG: hypothetical protein BJ554DRAFT_241 [Olpidium bornovanus]
MIQIDPQKRPDISEVYEVARANVNKHAAAAAAAAAGAASSAAGTKSPDQQPTAKSEETAPIT